MTIEEKAAAYDTIRQQRDAYVYVICELLDNIRSGCLNSWDLTDKGVAEDAENAVAAGEKFHLGPAQDMSVYEKTLRRFGLFHLGQLIRTAQWLEFKMVEFGWKPAEMVELYKKFDPKEVKRILEDHRSFLQEDKPRELKHLVTALFLLLAECPIGDGLPADEQSIYHDNLKAIISQLMKHVGVDLTDKDQLIDAIREYDPNITFAKDK